MFYANRGMFLETIINYTIEIINNEKQALIFKQNPPILYQNNKILNKKVMLIIMEFIMVNIYVLKQKVLSL
ncbi:hypothetical protein [Spiroplasma endosymbiont of Notiophilus biguttatus]|uniref:hypothetical protein n=1 Tax=Spiroplasma endosymbiont of Notiophilus biguttatus TaxID=3066285 RepID=UPI00313DA842